MDVSTNTIELQPTIQEKDTQGHSKVKTARKATGNHLGYFP